MRILLVVILLFGLGSVSSESFARGCSSDFSCGSGQVCVKAPFKIRGECMKSVNEYGVQTYKRPRTSSVYAGDSEGQCRFNTDCPIGFKCERRLKACIKR